MGDAVFITAPAATLQDFHKALVLLGPYDDLHPEGDESPWRMIYSTSMGDIIEKATPPLPPHVPTSNAWAGKTVDEVFAWITAHKEALKEGSISSEYCLVVDEQGLKDGTAILVAPCLRPVHDDDDEFDHYEYTNECKWFRADMSEAKLAITCIPIAHPGFESFVEEPDEFDEDAPDVPGEHKWAGSFEKTLDQLEKNAREGKLYAQDLLDRRLNEMRRRRAALQEARIKGWIAAE